MNQIAVSLGGLDPPKFKVNERSMRDRLSTLLITKHKAKIGQEENSTGITCEETELEQALEDIIKRGSWPTKIAPRYRKKKRKKEQLERNTDKALWNV